MVDHAEWKDVFDADPVGRKSHGATRHWIFQDHKDRNHFVLSMEFPTVDEAEGFVKEPMLKRSWEISGAGREWVLEEAETISY